MKKKMMILLAVVSMIAVMASFCLAGCTKDAEEVEVKGAFQSLRLAYAKELMNGDLDHIATVVNDISPTMVEFDGLDMLHYSSISFNWDFDVASKYRFTRITFDVTINNFDYPVAQFEAVSNYDGNDTISFFSEFDFTPDEPVSVEMSFGEKGIVCGTRNNTRYFRIRKGQWDDAEMNEALRYMNWKISNLKIFGIEK